ALVTPGPQLSEERHDHAAVVAVGVPMVFGGYGMAGTPLKSVEALTSTGGVAAFKTIAQLTFARAEATASLLADGSILVVGGCDETGAPRADAELYNPITRSTTV